MHRLRYKMMLFWGTSCVGIVSLVLVCVAIRISRSDPHGEKIPYRYQIINSYQHPASHVSVEPWTDTIRKAGDPGDNSVSDLIIESRYTSASDSTPGASWPPESVPDTVLDRRMREAVKNASMISTLNKGKPIRIQWRTTWFGKNADTYRTGLDPFKHCPLYNCRIVPTAMNNKRVEAFIFHNFYDKFRIPSKRYPWQKYIFFTKESETRVTIPRAIRSLFNLTMSHRLDADIPVPYGVIRQRMPSDSAFRNGTNFAAGKTGLVAWVVSNCHSTSRREQYVAELRKHISVDVYGDCGDIECPKVNCWETINKKYKFYLAFENSLCEDYITEKVYRTLFLGKLVPIVLGIDNYSKRLPRHSYIDITNFKGPQALAHYLKILDDNEFLYNEYFHWHHQYKSELRSTFSYHSEHFNCRLCAYLQLTKSERKMYPDIREWFSKDKCLNPVDYYKNCMGIM